jgi:hypothetical protein
MAGPRKQDADKKRHRDDGDEKKRSHETLEENGWRPCPKLRLWAAQDTFAENRCHLVSRFRRLWTGDEIRTVDVP